MPRHVRIPRLRLDSIHPSPENERLYRPVDPAEAEQRAKYPFHNKN